MTIESFIILQRTSTNYIYPKVAESKKIGANHLEFVKFLFQHYSELAFNFYFNEKIAYLLGTLVNTKYPITYASKGKKKLQTSAVISQRIQPLTWKKTRVKSSNNPSYHYTLGSAINITSIQAIDANYFIVPQILSQFICGLYSKIFQHVCPLHSVMLQAAITQTRDFESAELEANHAQAPQIIYQTPTVQTLPSNPAQMTLENPRLWITQNWRSAIVVHQPISNSFNQPSGLHSQSLETGYIQNPNLQYYLSLLITSEDVSPNNLESNQQPTLTNNISPATSTKDKTLATIFLFKLEEMNPVLLFSEAVLDTKPITIMYTDAKVDNHQVDCAASACIITTNGATKTPIDKIDDFSIEVNDIIVPIKVLVMEATQYQALIGNDWLSKINTMLNWNTQKLQLSQNRVGRRQQEKKKKKKEENVTEKVIDTKKINSGWTNLYSVHKPLPQLPYIPLKCKDCKKKLSSMGALVAPDKNYWTHMYYYYKPCHRE
ncbi:hypothetical protein G9A89_014124 [Geosiphon pyriformis]|nr:hypothetical protein G9A89_014124 [Geosiphon pyriformis]